MLEIVRLLILIIGWPLLVAGTLYVLYLIRNFDNNLRNSAIVKFIRLLVGFLLLTMYSLGLVSTLFMAYNLEVGLRVVTPIFTVWFIVMIASLINLRKLSIEANSISKFYTSLLKDIKKDIGKSDT